MKYNNKKCIISVGQTAGYFMGYVFFMALESYGLVTLPGQSFCPLVYLVKSELFMALESYGLVTLPGQSFCPLVRLSCQIITIHGNPCPIATMVTW